MNLVAALVLIQVGATWALVGLIWFVQLVHYPLMAAVGGEGFTRYQAAHVQRTSWVVVPLMLLEAASSLALIFVSSPLVHPGEATLGLGLLAGVWTSTFFLQVPLHERLAEGFDPRGHRSLVRTNWIRTALWSARGVLVLWWLARGLA